MATFTEQNLLQLSVISVCVCVRVCTYHSRGCGGGACAEGSCCAAQKALLGENDRPVCASPLYRKHLTEWASFITGQLSPSPSLSLSYPLPLPHALFLHFSLSLPIPLPPSLSIPLSRSLSLPLSLSTFCLKWRTVWKGGGRSAGLEERRSDDREKRTVILLLLMNN